VEIITTHTNVDFDALASCIGAWKVYPDAGIVLPHSQERGVRDLVFLLKDRLTLLEEKDIDLEDVKKLIVVETRSLEKIGKFKAIVNLPNIDVHLYDHHQRMATDIKGCVDVLVNTGATVTYFVEKIKDKSINISPLEATILALGIYEDTGSFTFPNTTPKDIRAAAFLVEKGADLTVIAKTLRTELTEEEIATISKMLHSTSSVSINCVQVAISCIEVEKPLPDAALLTHKLLDIENFDTLFVLISSPFSISVIARSRNPYVDVGLVARALGGGGHCTAASAVLRNIQVQKARDRIISLLKTTIKPPKLAQHIMSTPVKTISEEQTVQEARRIMIRFGIAGLPVINKNKPVGIVTRSDMDKASRHGLKNIPVKGCLSGKPVLIKKDTPLSCIQQIMAEHRIGRLLVMHRKRIIGIVSRSDVLRALHKGLVEGLDNKKQGFPDRIHIGDMLRENLQKNILSLLERIGKYAKEKNIPLYAVGGFVRDIILKKQNPDIDLVVEADAIKFATYISKKEKGHLTFHKAFGTATVILPCGTRIDLATARKEYYQYPAALPNVERTSLHQDISRRDFTINAMAIRIDEKEFGEIIDYYKGWEDIKNKKIRVLHSLSFIEDPTRIFRAVRLEKKLGFRIEKNTKALIDKAVKLQIIGRLESQRIRDELTLIFEEEKPVRAIDRMHQLHELAFINQSLKYPAQTRALINGIDRALDILGRGKIKIYRVYWAGLLMYLNKKDVEDVIKKFMFSKEDASVILRCRDIIKISKQLLLILRPHQIYDLLINLPKEALVLIIAKEKKVKKKVLDFINIYQNITAPISGDDLKSLGLKPGPEYGKILRRVKSFYLDGKVKTRQQILEYVKQRHRGTKAQR
jgi:tRNA nucleotidyltransferase (CCA-adding enzyme)